MPNIFWLYYVLMKLLDRLKTRLDTMMTKKERDMQRLLMLIKEQSFHNFIFLRHHRIQPYLQPILLLSATPYKSSIVIMDSNLVNKLFTNVDGPDKVGAHESRKMDGW